MAILQEANAVFYHPLDDPTEFLQTQAWPGDGTFPAGKVADAFGPVLSDTIGFGAEAEFDTSGQANDIPVVTLSATAFVVAHRNGFGTGLARVGTVSGTGTIAFGATATWLAGGTGAFVAAAALDSATFVVAWQDGAGFAGTARVGTVSGTDITFGAEVEFLSSSAALFISAATLDSATFVVVYSDNSDSNHGTAKVGTVSGTDITFGAEAEFHSTGATSYNSATALSASAFVVAYQTGSNHGTAKVGTVSGTDITFGAETEFTTFANFISATALSATAFVVAFKGATSVGEAKVGTVAGTDITFGASTEFAGAGTDEISAAALSPTRFVVAYRDAPDAGHGTAKVGTVSGTDITFGAEKEFLAATQVSDNSVAALGGDRFVVVYKDLADSGHGTAKVGGPSPLPAALSAPAPPHSFSPVASVEGSFVGGPGSITALSPTKFVVVYLNGNVLQNRVKVGTVSGTDITFGLQRTLTSVSGGWSAQTAVGTLSATRVAFAFANSSGAQVAIGTVSGTDITIGPTAQFLPSFTAGSISAKDFSIAVLSATSVVVSYENESSTIGASVVATISGLAVTFGAESQFMPAGSGTFQLSSVGLSASTFVVVYRDRSDLDHGTAKVGTVVATSIVFGAESEFLAGTVVFPSVAALSATKIVVAYGVVSSGDGVAHIGTISGTSVTFAAAVPFFTAVASSTSDTFVAALTPDKFVVVYLDSTGADSGESAVGTVSGTDIAFSAEVQYLGTGTTWNVVAALSASKFIVSYKDNATTFAKAKVGTFVDPYPTVVGGEHVTFASWSRSPNANPPTTTPPPVTTMAP